MAYASVCIFDKQNGYIIRTVFNVQYNQNYDVTPVIYIKANRKNSIYRYGTHPFAIIISPAQNPAHSVTYACILYIYLQNKIYTNLPNVSLSQNLFCIISIFICFTYALLVLTVTQSQRPEASADSRNLYNVVLVYFYIFMYIILEV